MVIKVYFIKFININIIERLRSNFDNFIIKKYNSNNFIIKRSSDVILNYYFNEIILI